MSDDGAMLKLHAALAECALHSAVLSEALALLPASFAPADVQSLGTETRRLLDQLAFRFMKLQDSLGEKVLPGLLAASLDPLPDEAPFVQKLNRLERLGAVPSVEPRSGSWPLSSACKCLMCATRVATTDITCRVSALHARSSRPRPRWRRCKSSQWHGPLLRFAPCQRGR